MVYSLLLYGVIMARSNFSVSVILLVVLANNAHLKQGGVRQSGEGSCRQNQECVNLGSCPREMRRLHNRGAELSEGEARVLRDNVCGLDPEPQARFPIKVCCPVRKSKETASSSLRPSKRQNSTRRCRPFQHKYMNVLPSECGISNPYEPHIAPRIVGGNMSKYYDLPWMAQLLFVDNRANIPQLRCGGTLISPRFVLTAAHCFEKDKKYGVVPNWVLLGMTDEEDDSWKEPNYADEENSESEEKQKSQKQTLRITDKRQHPYFNPHTLENDIALVLLESAAYFTQSVAPVCLPVKEFYCQEMRGAYMIVSGWGTTSTADVHSPHLLQVNVPLVSVPECKRRYKQQVHRGQTPTRRISSTGNLCAGGKPGEDSCKGDSGGPLQMTVRRRFDPESQNVMVQYGVVSYGFQPCGTPGMPAVYTAVAHYLPWILRTMDDTE